MRKFNHEKLLKAQMSCQVHFFVITHLCIKFSEWECVVQVWAMHALVQYNTLLNDMENLNKIKENKIKTFLNEIEMMKFYIQKYHLHLINCGDKASHNTRYV